MLSFFSFTFRYFIAGFVLCGLGLTTTLAQSVSDCINLSTWGSTKLVFEGVEEIFPLSLYGDCEEGIAYTIESNVPWLKVPEESKSGVLKKYQSVLVSLELDYGTLERGHHEGIVTIRGVGDDESAFLIRFEREVVARDVFSEIAPTAGGALLETKAGRLVFLKKSNNRSEIYSLNADGSLRWQYLVGEDEIVESMALAEMTNLVLVSSRSRLIACDLDTGELEWEYTLTNGWESPSLLAINEAAGAVFWANEETMAFSLTSGEAIWRVATPEPVRILGYQDVVFVGSKEKLYALSGASGRLLWAQDGSFENWVIAADGTLVLFSGKLKVDYLDPHSGVEIQPQLRFSGYSEFEWWVTAEGDLISAYLESIQHIQRYTFPAFTEKWSYRSNHWMDSIARKMYLTDDDSILLVEQGLTVIDATTGIWQSALYDGLVEDAWLTRNYGVLFVSPDGTLLVAKDLAFKLFDQGWPSEEMVRAGTAYAEPEAHILLKSNGLEKIAPFFIQPEPLEYIVEVSEEMASVESDVSWMRVEEGGRDGDWIEYRVTIDTSSLELGDHSANLRFNPADEGFSELVYTVNFERTRVAWTQHQRRDILGLDDSGAVLVRGEDGRISALEIISGEEIWVSSNSYPSYAGGVSVVNIREGLLYVPYKSNYRENLVALDLATGGVAFDLRLESLGFAVTLSPDNVLITTEETRIAGYHPRSGVEIWTIEDENSGFSSIVFDADGKLFLGDSHQESDGRYQRVLYGINTTTGSIAWGQQLGLLSYSDQTPKVFPMEGGRVVVTYESNALEFYDGSTGSYLETRNVSQPFDELVALTDDLQWITEWVSFSGTIFSGDFSSPQKFLYYVERVLMLLDGRRAFTSTFSGELVLVDLETHEILEVYSELSPNDILLTNDGLLILESAYDLSVLYTDGEQIQPSLWPMKGGNSQRTGYADALLDPPPVLLDRGSLSASISLDYEESSEATFRLKSESGEVLDVTLESYSPGISLSSEHMQLSSEYSEIGVSIDSKNLPLGEHFTTIRIYGEADHRLLREIPIRVFRSRKLWEITLQENMLSSPAVDSSGRIFFRGNTVLRCLDDRTGNLVWEKSFSSSGSSGSQPVLSFDEKTLYLIQDYKIQALSAESGELIWSHRPSETGIYSYNDPLVLSKSGVLVCRHNFDLCGLDAQTGEILWLTPISISPLDSLINENTIVIWDSLVVAGFDLATGAPQWSYQIPPDLISYYSDSIERVAPGLNDSVVVLTKNGNLYELSCSAGLLNDSLKLGVGNTAYSILQSPDGDLVATGRSVWKRSKLSSPDSSWPDIFFQEVPKGMNALLDDSGVFFTVGGTNSRTVHALDAITGETLYELPAVGGGTLAMTTSGVLLVSGSSTITAFQTEASGLADSPWPTTLGDSGNRRNYSITDPSPILLRVNAFSETIRVTDTARVTEREFAIRTNVDEARNVRFQSSAEWIFVSEDEWLLNTEFEAVPVGLDATGLDFGAHQGFIEVVDVGSGEVLETIVVNLFVSREVSRISAYDLNNDVPVIDAEGTLYYVAHRPGYANPYDIHARERDSSESRWSIALEGEESDDSGLMLSSDENHLYILKRKIGANSSRVALILESRSTEDGSLEWRQEYPPSVHIQLSSTHFGMLIFRGEKNLTGVLESNGAVAWRCALPSSPANVPVIGTDGIVSVISEGVIYQIDPKDGTVIRTIEAEVGLAYRQVLPCSEGGLYALTTSGRLQKITGSNASILWEYGQSISFSALSLVGHNDQLFAKSGSELYALSGDTGEVQWESDFDPSLNNLLLGEENRIYLSSENSVIALNAVTGEVLWREDFSNVKCFGMALRDHILDVIAFVAFDPYGKVEYGAYETQFVQLMVPDQGLADTLWPILEGDLRGTGNASVPFDLEDPVYAVGLDLDLVHLDLRTPEFEGEIKFSATRGSQQLYLTSDQPWLTLDSTVVVSADTISSASYRIDRTELAIGNHVAKISLHNEDGEVLTTRTLTLVLDHELRRISNFGGATGSFGFLPAGSGRVLSPWGDNQVSLVDIESNQVIWTIERRVTGSMVDLESGLVYCTVWSSYTNIRGSVFCLDLETGALLWEVSDSFIDEMSMALAAQMILIDGVGLDKRTGKVLYRYPRGKGGYNLRVFNDYLILWHESTNDCYIVDLVTQTELYSITDGQVVFPMDEARIVTKEGSGNSVFRIRDIESGNVLVENSEATNNTIYATTPDRVILGGYSNYKPHVTVLDGNLSWVWDFSLPDDQDFYSLYVTPRDEVIVVTRQGVIYALNASDGALAWRQDPFLDSYINSPSLDPNGILSASGNQGDMIQYALPWSDKVRSAWPQYAGNAYMQNASFTPSEYDPGQNYTTWAEQIPRVRYNSRYPEADPDGDGVSNIFEFILMKDPEHPDSELLSYQLESGKLKYFSDLRADTTEWLRFVGSRDLEIWEDLGVDFESVEGDETKQNLQIVTDADDLPFFIQIKLKDSPDETILDNN